MNRIGTEPAHTRAGRDGTVDREGGGKAPHPCGWGCGVARVGKAGGVTGVTGVAGVSRAGGVVGVGRRRTATRPRTKPGEARAS
jgi:hypothetical protein